MRIRLFMLLTFVMLTMVGCGTDDPWSSMVNKEFSNMDNWAGSGFYFYESDNERYCTYMIYGSGLPVIGNITSKIEHDGDQMWIQLPVDEALMYFEIDAPNTQDTIGVELTYENEKIIVNGMEFDFMEGLNNHEYVDGENQ